VGNFAGDSKPDLVGYHPSNGTLWVGTNTGSNFHLHKWYGENVGNGKNLSPPDNWTFLVGNFAGDSKPDLVGYQPGDGTVRIGTNNGRDLEGYVWPLSAAPGETIEFKVSGRGSGEVTFYRHKANAKGVTSTLMSHHEHFDPQIQTTLAAPWRNGCGWTTTSFRLTIPEDWPSGIYSAELTDAEGDKSHVTFIVKPNPDKRSRLAVLANVNTWLAYNRAGGRGKYAGAAHVSFLRPNPAASPVAERRQLGTHPYHLARGELWVLGWLKDEGYQPDVYTDIDFHNGSVHGEYKTLILSTHPEYWSLQMYDNLQAFLTDGGSLLYLGGNGIYENGEYTDDQTGMVFRAGDEDGPRAAALFRRLDPPRPERAVLGVATERCGVEGAPYEVQRADHTFFQGTGLRNGDTFGESGLNTGHGGNGAASGWEVDTSDGPGATGIPTSCASGNEQDFPVPPGPGLPSGLMILATSIPTDCANLEIGRCKGAEMVYYDHPGGGFVFSVGSITFGGSLVVDEKIQQIVRNALSEAESRR
jgi:hypothetical protein